MPWVLDVLDAEIEERKRWIDPKRAISAENSS